MTQRRPGGPGHAPVHPRELGPMRAHPRRLPLLCPRPEPLVGLIPLHVTHVESKSGEAAAFPGYVSETSSLTR